MLHGWNYLLQKLAERKVLDVKPFQGTLGKGWCCPSSLKIILDYYGDNYSEDYLAKLCGSSLDHGTTGPQLRAAAEYLGYKVEIKDNSTYDDIKKYLDKDVPVMVNWFCGNNGTGEEPDDPDTDVPGGHYSIAIGFDDEHIYINDPKIGRIREMGKKDFMSVWFDFSKENLKNPHDIILQRLIAITK